VFEWLTPRLKFLRAALFNRWVLIVFGIWTLFSNFATLRDNFLPVELQREWATPALMNAFAPKDWVIGLLAITAIALWEGAYRYNQTLIRQLLSKSKESIDGKEKVISDQETQIYALNRQLAMPDLFAEIIHGPAMNEQGSATSVFLAIGGQKDTEIRFQLRLSNRGRAETTMSKCELVIDPNDKRETYGPSPQYGLDTSTIIKFACPKELTVVFNATGRTILQLANRPYVLRITDGTGNVVMTKVHHFT
jgi:hypothetical protein